MKKVKTYWWFWIWIPFLIVIGLIYNDATFDISIHDIYFVIASQDVYIVVSMFFFISGFGYFVKSPLYSKCLTKIHIVTTLLGIILLVSPFDYYGLFSPPRRYYEFASENFIDYLSNLSNTPILGFIFILLGITTYLFNLGFAIFKKTN